MTSTEPLNVGPGPQQPTEPPPPEGGLVISRGWKRVLLAAATLLSLALLAIGGHWAIRLGQFPWTASSCAGCHAMAPEVGNWQVGPHSQVSCVQCHGRVDLARYVFASATNHYRQPIESVQKVPTAACLSCHRFDRQVTPTKDLVIQHSFHVKLNLDCVSCHEYLVHGQPGHNTRLVPADFSQRVPMARCRTCHNGSMAPGECTTCHADASQPQTLKVVS